MSSFIQSIFTPPGTHARQQQSANQSQAAGYLSGLMPGEASYQQNLQTFRNTQLPNVEQGVNQAYYGTTQGGRNANAAAYGQQERAQANQAGAQAYSQFAGNPSLAQGYQLDQQNQANTNTANYAAQLNSPQGEQNAWSQYLGLLGASQPNYSGLSQLNAGVQGQAPAYVGSGLGSYLGQLAGMYLGSGKL